MSIDLLHSVVFLRDDGIIQINTKDHTYSVNDVIEINNAQGELCNGIKRPAVTFVDPYSNIESDAREYMATFESTRFSTAEAFVISSVGQKILANFYLKVNKPTVPTKIFTNLNSAVEWLRDYLPSDL